MSDVATTTKVLRGGEFLVRSTSPEEIFIPEEFNEEQRMIRDMVRDFVETHAFPNANKIENKYHYTFSLFPRLMFLSFLDFVSND